MGERLAVDGDLVLAPDVDRRVGQRHAVQGDAAFADPGFRLAAGAEPSPRHDLGDAFSGFFAIARRGFVALAQGPIYGRVHEIFLGGRVASRHFGAIGSRPRANRKPAGVMAARMLFPGMFAHITLITDYWLKREQRVRSSRPRFLTMIAPRGSHIVSIHLFSRMILS